MLSSNTEMKKLKKAIILGVNNIQPMPQVLKKARKIIVNSTAPLEDLTDIVESDPAITMKVLRIANSSYYRRRERISTVHEAAIVLGSRTLAEMIFIAFSSKPLGLKLTGYDVPSKSIWEHSLAVAFGAKWIAEHHIPELTGEAFSAGLIHDVGKLILDRYVCDHKKDLMKYTYDNKCSFEASEKAVLGFDHSEVTTLICERWMFSRTTTDAIRYHHNPKKSGRNKLAYILHAADQVAGWIGMDIDSRPLDIIDNTFGELGIGMEDVDPLIDSTLDAVSRITGS